LPTESELTVSWFASQKLVGYTKDDKGNVTAKVYEGVAVFADKSERTIYGVLNEGAQAINWEYSEGQEKPTIDIDRYGITIKKEKEK